ncbi:alpha-L-fucosidase 2 [Saonia flava]|uniref:Alpha-L-fucosidase 2 n=1 Tax=Saonia flava TaxID=523696 RepID=A0A846QWE5_9FLAO|nr:glycoside hydrolase N-terminal domain-containing protein [Saonia flava]NJB72661.1 alpha-L-fucosidase 2 [Saonia flava]
MSKYYFIFLSVLSLFSCQEQEKETVANRIWYDQPAEEWMEALPVGNGRLGAMIYGDPQHEHLQLNEDSMWPGGPEWGNSKGTKEDLDLIRKMLREDKPHEADKLIVDRFSYKGVSRSHQTMGDLYIDFQKERKIENYSRSLDLENAVVTVKYSYEGHDYVEKVFASAVDDVLVVEISTTAQEGMDFNLKLDRAKDEGHATVSTSNPSNNEISMEGMVTQFAGAVHSTPTKIDYGVKFQTRLKVKNTSGTVESKKGELQLRGVQKATMLIVCSTSFYHKNFHQNNHKTLSLVENKSFDELLKEHIQDYQKLYKRVDFDLGGYELDSLPINKRLQRIKDSLPDTDLAAKLFQYGRYLLISSSRPGTNPANLQGIWNEHIQAPWNADYHLNINIQMNYWPAEVTNLSECHMPLLDFSDKLLERGRIIAKEQYGINRGAMVHHTTDLWLTPWMRAERPYWGSWIHGGGWLGQHYWEHYKYTNDKDFLKERGYPYLKAVSEFYLDWLIMDERDGTWVSAPETSPENSYIASDGEPAAVSYGNAMGHQIIKEVFDNVLEAADLLEIDDSFTKEVIEKRRKLHPAIVIGDDGRILEWDRPYEEAEKGHRHMSHLYALHPGNDITSKDNKAFEAAKKTIAHRLQHGGAGTGWSRAWMINFDARLMDKESAEENITKFFQISLADNLFDMHPPFQIDGNFGYTAGVAELLMQSHEGFLRVLPTLPNNWETGNIKGLIARGNIEVDIAWENGKLVELVLTSREGKKIKIVYNGMEIEANLPKNTPIKLDGQLQIM